MNKQFGIGKCWIENCFVPNSGCGFISNYSEKNMLQLQTRQILNMVMHSSVSDTVGALC